VTCSLRGGENVCKAFNAGGLLIQDDDIYKPYDGGPPVDQQHLRIDAEHSDPGQLMLENGRILLRLKEFDWRKRLLDEEHGGRR
jgi:hypothetical protein